jgi:hypothetical protein
MARYDPDTFYASEATSFDAACGLYWYAADHHGGQWSDLYALLSRSQYHPSPMEHGPRDDASMAVYQLLASGVLDPWDLELWIDAKYDADTDGDR